MNQVMTTSHIMLADSRVSDVSYQPHEVIDNSALNMMLLMTGVPQGLFSDPYSAPHTVLKNCKRMYTY